jgi:3-dehydroquinate dehydratase-1
MYCLSTGNPNFQSLIEEIKAYDMAEIRLDLCNFNSDQIKNVFSIHPNLIATFRKNNSNNETQRFDSLKDAILSGAKWIDIDYLTETKEFIKRLTKIAKENKLGIIISYHDYEKTPSDEFIHEIYSKIIRLSPNLVKLVFYCNSEKDNERVLELYSKYSNIIAFNMGEKGKRTRIECIKGGALFTFVKSETEQTAEGQMTLKEIMQYS